MNFNTVLFSGLNTKRNDEIGVLARSTKNEREILNTFTSLTNKGVTQAIIKKEIDFEPHLKDITIFFSDIRGFTAISDGFKKLVKILVADGAGAVHRNQNIRLSFVAASHLGKAEAPGWTHPGKIPF